MFGLTFLNAIFLAGLAAAVLPILIHLFSKKKAQDVPFSSIEYLREISIKKVRRMRLRQFLLLALRVLIIACFAFAMMRPALQGTGSTVSRGSSTVAILLDNSYSMGAFDPAVTGALPDARALEGLSGGEEATLFGQAKKRALEVIDLMKDGDFGVLARTGRPVDLPFQTPVANLGLLRQEIERTTLAPQGSDLRAATEQVIAVLESSRTMNKEIFIISDFQDEDLAEWAALYPGGPDALRTARESFGAIRSFVVTTAHADEAEPSSGTPGSSGSNGSATGDGADSGGGEAVEVPEGVTVYLVPVREERQENASIADVSFDPSGGAAGAGRVTATIKNQGNDPISGRVIRLLEPGDPPTPLADVRFDAAPLAETEVDIDLTQASESGVLEVRLGPDLLEEDNLAHLVTSDPGHKEVLLVRGSLSGRSGDTPIQAETGLVQDDGLYIHRALDPTGDGRFHKVSEVAPSGLTDPTNLTVDVVVLSDVGRLSAAAVENLVRFKQRGGGVLIALGDRVDLRYYNAQILGRLAPSIELLNIMSEQGEGTYRSLRPAAAGHPVFRGFPVSVGDDLSSARFQRVVEAQAKDGGRVIAHFGNQIPALIESDGVVLFTSSMDGAWNDFVTSAAFLPLSHLVIEYLASRSGGDRGPRQVGDPLEAVVEGGEYETPVQFEHPDGSRSPVDPIQQGAMDRFRVETTSAAGLHQLTDATGKVMARFAVNLDPREGNLAVASAGRLQRTFGRDAQLLAVSEPITRDLLEGRYGRELWRPLLILVLLLLGIETVLARGRFLS